LRPSAVAAVVLLLASAALAGCGLADSADDDSGARTARRPDAVVGSFPEPLLHGSGGKRYPVVLECAGDAGAACADVAQRLADAGVPAARQLLGTGVGQDTLRVFVGPWRELHGDVALDQLDRGLRVSGVPARFVAGGARLALLDVRGATVRTLGAGAGLVAATTFAEQAPTWMVTGTDLPGVRAAAGALTAPRLAGHRALALAPGSGDLPLPLLRR
jgi:hypothetical protein